MTPTLVPRGASFLVAVSHLGENPSATIAAVDRRAWGQPVARVVGAMFLREPRAEVMFFFGGRTLAGLTAAVRARLESYRARLRAGEPPRPEDSISGLPQMLLLVVIERVPEVAEA